MPVATGTHVGPYEIVGWLGAGGMGEVYRARDPRLGREVAIKLIPETFATDASRLHRFEQEARAAGQLNHPNILTVYDVGTHEGAPYVVSELLEGESLGSRLREAPLAPRKAIDYARQIAEGLAAAHDKGIVHRDLKPDNLFVTSEGRVKILDFGIAKLTQPADDAARHTETLTETGPGTVVGTAGYMSPEQVRGETVDHRSDIFSFGAVLYEMVTGRPAFTRETAADTMAAILKEDPPEPSSATVPPALGRIVDALSGEGARGALSVGTRPGVRPGVSRGDERRRIAGRRRDGAAALAYGAGHRGRRAESVDGRSELADPAHSTGACRSAGQRPVLALHGLGGHGRRRRNFARREVRRVPGRPRRSVRPLGEPGGHRTFCQPHVRYPAAGPPAHILRRLRLFGRRSGDLVQSQRRAIAAHAHDGRHATSVPERGRERSRPGLQMARASSISETTADPLFIADRTGADAREILAPQEGAHNHNPVWSPDGQWIYFVHGLVRKLNQTDDMDVWRIRASGGSPERLTRQKTAVNFLAPLDPRTLLYVARAEDRSGPWLWSLDVESKVTRRVSSGLDQYTSVASSRDGRRVVATVAKPSANLWRVPLLDRLAEDSDVEPYPLPTARALAPRFGGTSLFYLSSRGTGDGLWRVQDGQALEIRQGADGALSEPPAVSPDGRRVAVVLGKEGKQHLAIMSADGTDSRTLAASIDIQGTADWSPDGKWIVAGGSDAQGPALFKIPVDGGAPVRLVGGQAVNPVWSRDGKLIVYAGPLVAGDVPLLGVRPDGAPVELPPVRVRRAVIGSCPTERAWCTCAGATQSLDFWLLDLATKTTRQLTRLSNQGDLRTFDITPDGKHIVFDRSRENSDIVLIDLPK